MARKPSVSADSPRPLGARVLGLLSLAPTPTFALLGLLSAAQEGSLESVICSAGHGSSMLTGMVSMYLLMSVFHSAPWIRMIAQRRRTMQRATLCWNARRADRN
jgi:hypothetical protein